VDRPALDEATRSAVDWLLASTEPAIRHLTRRDLLAELEPEDGAAILKGL
jgi:hypothetical protein